MEQIDGILVANQIPKICGCFLRIGGASFHVAGELNLEAVREPERSRLLGCGTHAIVWLGGRCRDRTVGEWFPHTPHRTRWALGFDATKSVLCCLALRIGVGLYDPDGPVPPVPDFH